MKKIKLKGLLLILLLLTVLFLSFQSLTQTYIFNSSQAYSHVIDLSSPEYEGRKPSTEGNLKALAYAEKLLNDSGFETIRQSFSALVPFIEDKPVFELLDENGQIIKCYIHRKDYKEVLSGYAAGGSVNSKFIIDGKSVYDLKSKIFNDSIVIVNNDYNGKADQDLAYIKAKVKAILIPYSTESILKASGYPGYDKSSFLSKKDKIIKIYITYDVFTQLKSKCKQIEENLFVSENSKINLSLSLSFKNVKTENIIARLKNEKINTSTNDFAYLGFSAHIDHLGKDPDGSYFPGALDNASGVAFVLEMAKVLANYKDILTVNPLIILFNAEENGLCGSEYFVHSNFMNLLKLNLINFDMVASEEPVSYNLLFYQGNKSNHPAKEFALKIRSFGANNDFKFILDNLSSNTDHYPFNEAGYTAASLNQFPESFYHTYNDTVDKVSASGLDQLGKFMEKFILENYTVKKQSLYNIYFVIFILTISIGLHSKIK
ncbi:MAG: Zn-dependent exopeptidase M28 [Spirochaetales bacterium]|nr:Zn-dependent exopeptidase M28 [Spirochaetales bacterium]